MKLRSGKQISKVCRSLKCDTEKRSAQVSKVKQKRKKTAFMRRLGQCSALPTALMDQAVVSSDIAFTNDSMNSHQTALNLRSVYLGSSSDGNITDLSSRHSSCCAKTSPSNGGNVGSMLQVYHPLVVDVTSTRNKEGKFKTNTFPIIDSAADKISEHVQMSDEVSISLLKIPFVKKRHQDILVGTLCQKVNDSPAPPTYNNEASAQEDDSCSVISLGSDSEVIILDSDPKPQLNCSSTSDVVVIDTVSSAKRVPTLDVVTVDPCTPLRQSNKFQPHEFTTQKSAGHIEMGCSRTSDVVIIGTVSSANHVPTSYVATVDPCTPLRQSNEFQPHECSTQESVGHAEMDCNRTSDVVVIDMVSSARRVPTSDVVTVDPCTPLRQSNKFQPHEFTTQKSAGHIQVDCSRTSDVIVVDTVSSAKDVPTSAVVTLGPCAPLRQSNKFQPHDCTTQKSISCNVGKKRKKIKQKHKAVPENDVSVSDNVLQTVQNKPNCLSSVRNRNVWPGIMPFAAAASASLDCAPGSNSGVGWLQQGHTVTAISSAVGYSQVHVTNTLSAGVHCGGLQHCNNNAARVGLQTISNQGNPTNVPCTSLYGTNLYNPNPYPVRSGLRPIIIDGSNVAMRHSNGRIFSCKGLKICIDYFLKRWHKVVAFVPQFRKSSCHSLDTKILDDLEKQGLVSFTPSRKIGNRLVVPYDDRYIVQYAAECGGVIVSTDNYRDLLKENPAWRETIENRLLMFTWVGDVLMFPQDPLGRYGPNLDRFLRFP